MLLSFKSKLLFVAALIVSTSAFAGYGKNVIIAKKCSEIFLVHSEDKLQFQPKLPSVFSKASEVFKRNGINYVLHGVYFQALQGILSSGHIYPKAKLSNEESSQGRNDVIYLEPYSKRMSGAGLSEIYSNNIYNLKWSIKLVFDVGAVDGTGFFINRGWRYGEFSEQSVIESDSLGMNALLEDLNDGHLVSSEIILPKEIDLRHLVAIWTTRGSRIQVIDILRQINFKPANSLSLEEFVIDYNNLN